MVLAVPTSNTQASVVVYPNPFQDAFTIQYEAEQDENLDIALYDYAGRVVWSQSSMRVVSGTNQIFVDLNEHAQWYLFPEN